MARLTLDDLVYRLGFENEEEFLRALDRLMGQAEEAAREGGKRAGREFGEGMREGGEVFGGVIAAEIVKEFATRVADFIAESLRTVAEMESVYARFENSLHQAAVSGVKDLESLKQKIREIADESRVFSQAEVAESVASMVKAGFDAASALEIVRRSTLLARAEFDSATQTFGDLADAAEVVGAVLRSMDLQIEDSARVVDVLARAAQDSALDLGDFTRAFATVAPVAHAAGLSLEDVAASLAVLSNRGFPAEQAARGLRSLLSSLIKPSATVRDEFDRLGISLVTATGQARPFAEALANIGRVAESGPRGLQTLARGMDTFALNIAQALGQASGEVATFTDRLQHDAAGAAQKLAESAGDTATALGEVAKAGEDLRLAIGELLAPSFVWFVNSVLVPFVRWLTRARDALTSFFQRIFEVWDQLHGAPANLTFEQRLRQVRIQEQQTLKELADLEGRVARAREHGWRVPDMVRRRIEALRQELDLLRRQERALEVIIRRQKEAAAQPKPKMPPPPHEGEGAPGVPEAPPPGGRPPGERQPTFVDRAERHLSVLRAKLQLGRLEESAYVRELMGLYARLGKAREEALRAGDDAEAARAIQLMARIKVEVDRIEARVEAIRRDLASYVYDEFAGLDEYLREQARKMVANLWPPGGEFAGMDQAIRWYARFAEQVGPVNELLTQGMMTTARAASVLGDYLDRLQLAYETGQVDTLAYREQLADLEGTIRELVALLPQGSEEWADWTRVLSRVEQELARVKVSFSDLGEYVMGYQGADVARLFGLDGVERANRWLQLLRDGALDAGRGLAFMSDWLRRLNLQAQAGVITQEEYRRTLDGYLQAVEAALALIPAESQEYTELLSIIIRLRQELQGLAQDSSQQSWPDFQNLWPPGGEFAGMDRGIRQSRDYTQQQIADLTNQLATRMSEIADNWAKRLVDGIRRGNLAGALNAIVSDAANLFLDLMLRAIVGPIAKSLASSIASAVVNEGLGSVLAGTSSLGALGPVGLILGGAALLFSLLAGGGGTSQRAPMEAARAASAPSQIVYHAETNVNVALDGGINDPATLAAIRSMAEDVTISTLRRLGLLKGGQA